MLGGSLTPGRIHVQAGTSTASHRCRPTSASSRSQTSAPSTSLRPNKPSSSLTAVRSPLATGRGWRRSGRAVTVVCVGARRYAQAAAAPNYFRQGGHAASWWHVVTDAHASDAAWAMLHPGAGRQRHDAPQVHQGRKLPPGRQQPEGPLLTLPGDPWHRLLALRPGDTPNPPPPPPPPASGWPARPCAG